MQNKKESTYGCGVLIKSLKAYTKDSSRSLTGLCLCGVSYKDFFIPIEQVFKKNKQKNFLCFLRSLGFRFLGEILFENEKTYPQKFRYALLYQKRKYNITVKRKEKYLCFKKDFEGLWVMNIFGSFPKDVAKRLGYFLQVNEHVQIRDKEYRQLFIPQKNVKKELLAHEYRKYHLHIFFHHYATTVKSA
jgi:hypothetical protein